MEYGRRMFAFLKIALLFSILAECQGQLEGSSDEECCLPEIPIQPYFDTLPHNRTGGVQAILPYHKFNCEGVINHIVVQTKGESSRLDVQLWSPSESRTYSLKWSVSFSGDENSVFQEVQPPNTEHEGSLLVFYSQRGLPVSQGDVLGYYIEQNNNPIQLGFVDTGKVPGAQHSVIYALENVTGPVCSMSLCDAGLRSFYHAAPLIHAEFVETDDDGWDTTSLTCTERAVPSCDVFDPIDDSGSTDSTSPPITTDVLSSQTTASSQSSSLTPLATTNASGDSMTMPTEEPSRTSTEPTEEMMETSSFTQAVSASSEEVGMPVTEEVPVNGYVIHIDPLVIILIVVGGFLLVTLIILVFVLIFCLCRKRNPKSAKMRRRRLTDVESVESRATATTHLGLAVSSSAEHSNSSNLTTQGMPNRDRAANGVTANGNGHTYANADLSQDSNFSLSAPLYVNGSNAANGHVRASSADQTPSRDAPPNRRFGVKRARERVWSTGALHNHRINAVNPTHSSVHVSSARAPPRARSCSSNLSHAIKEPSLPPPSPPPRSRSNSETAGLVPQDASKKGPKRLANRYSAIETPTGNSKEGEQSNKRPKSHSVHVVNNIAIDRRAWTTLEEEDDLESHDYADPDHPSEDEEQDCLFEPRYDKLVAQIVHHVPYDDVDIYPEEYVDGSPPPLPPKSIRSAVYQDPVGSMSNSRENIPLSPVHCGYVPTVEQRRLLQLQHGGHYEIADGVKGTEIDGYDHLTYFEETDTYWAPAATTTDLYDQLSANKYRELPRSQIKIMKRIGSGHFGTVSKGVWHCGEDQKEVAVKTVKATTEQERIKLLQEAAIMGQFAHVNVVRLHGVVTVGEPVLIVLEYMTRGDLRSFLQKLHPRTSKRELPDVVPKLFIKFSKDIAGGMSYLSKKNFIHRDLAARNILLTHDLTCKIGDFGMARDIEGENDYYKSHGGIIPVKWTAPEALIYNKYSSASDVWSYGMVLFEIWSLGEKPFNDLTNPIVIALVSSKHCQPPPPGCPRPIYHLMIECWNPDHNRRPNFDSIHDYLESPEESLLQWQDADVVPGKQAHMLGAVLSEANDLYLDLQRTYQKPPPFSSKI